MENLEQQRSLIRSSDIESRLIILKRRAAEADFLREERDMLINRLKLYNPDYIWPDTGINKCLNMPIDKEYEELGKKADDLLAQNEDLKKWKDRLESENNDLKSRIGSLEKELEEVKKDIMKLEVLSMENEQLKVSLEEMTSIQEENNNLSAEKEQLKEDLSKLLDNASNDPENNYKILLKQLYVRIDNCTQQYNNILQELWSKDVQIDVLTGKITQLNARLNEPYISAKIKLSMGKDLTEEEAYMWAVSNLEITNKKMSCELQKVTEQLNLVTEKYLKMKDEFKPQKPFRKEGEKRDKFGVLPQELEAALLNLYDGTYDDNKTGEMEETDIYDLSREGSTAHVSRDVSLESMFHFHDTAGCFKKVQILRENTRYMEEIYLKLSRIKYVIRKEKEMDSFQRTRALSRIQNIKSHQPSVASFDKTNKI